MMNFEGLLWPALFLHILLSCALEIEQLRICLPYFCIEIKSVNYTGKAKQNSVIWVSVNMWFMDYVLEILKITLPSLIVFFTTYFLVKRYFESEEKKNFVDTKFNASEKVLPMRIQAYERVVLYLERINPNNLIMRVYRPSMSAAMLHSELLKAIRDEYDHNMSQQIYLSSEGWKLVKIAKDETIQLINFSMEKLTKKAATGSDLSQVIFEIYGHLETEPTDVASEYLKKELRRLF